MSSKPSIVVNANGSTSLWHGCNGHTANKVLETTGSYVTGFGVTVYGKFTNDSATINQISVPDGGTSGHRINIGTGDDLTIKHDSSNSSIVRGLPFSDLNTTLSNTLP